MKHRGKAEGSAFDLSRLEPGYNLRQTAHLPNHNITIRHESVLSQINPCEKIRDGADAGDADAFAAHLLDPLDLRRRHREDKHTVDRDRDINRVRAGEFGIHARRAADRRNVYASADQRLDSP